MARVIHGARREAVERHIAHYTKVDPAYGEGVRKAYKAIGAPQGTSSTPEVE